MEHDRHIVLIVRGIESRNIDIAGAQAIPKVARIQRRLPVILQPLRSTILVLILYPYCPVSGRGLSSGRRRGRENGEERDDQKGRKNKS